MSDRSDTPEHASRARSFLPVMALGLAASGGAAVATTRGWVDFGTSGAAAMAAVARVPDKAPVPGTLALVVLAGFGTLLVTRGRVRRLLAAATTAGAAALVCSIVISAPRLLDQARAGVAAFGAGSATPSLNGWVWTSGLTAVVALIAATAAWRWAPSWPEMGRRYDAPGDGSEPNRPSAGVPQSSEDWWRAIDAGTDPSIPDPRE
ncbi:MAG: Trp biosynthesis-associated membrane protein [Nocardioides sp.]